MPVMAGRKARHGGCSQAPRRGDEVAVTLDELAKEGARRMIAAALEAEVEQYVAAFVEEVGEDGKRLVVRNGHARERGLTQFSSYWQTIARFPVAFDRSWKREIPDHWHVAGARTSAAENKARARKATTPVHAMLNYTYAVLETEATIAAHKLGFDPSIGLMHADKRYRGSLATDLMEPVRPVADALVLGLLRDHVVRRGDVVETHEGVVRIGPPLAQTLAALSDGLRAAVAPHAEQLARTLLQSANYPRPLTRARHAAALGR